MIVEPMEFQTTIKGYLAAHKYMRLTTDGVLTLFEGYCWDGPSGPTWDSPNSMVGSLAHDALYQSIRRGAIPKSERANIDEFFYRLLIKSGMGRVRSWYFYRAVRMFGWSAIARHEGRVEILQAK